MGLNNERNTHVKWCIATEILARFVLGSLRDTHMHTARRSYSVEHPPTSGIPTALCCDIYERESSTENTRPHDNHDSSAACRVVQIIQQ